MSPRATERLLIAGALFKKPLTDVAEIQARIAQLPDDKKQRLKELVDWVEQYANAKLAKQK